MLQSLQNSCQWVFIFYLQWYVKFFLILDSNYRSSQVETNRQASLRLSSGQGICRKNYRGDPDRLPQDGELIWPAWGVNYFSHHGRCRVF